MPGVRPQDPGHEIDEGRLAGAVRADQRVAVAALQAKIDGSRHGQGAEALVEAAHLERRPRRHRRHLSIRPNTPPRAKTTTSTISSPIQKYQ